MRGTFTTLLTAAAGGLSLLALAGCDQIDPMTRPYVWQQQQVNPHNIAAMAVNPTDLIHGREDTSGRAAPGAEAVDRVWANRPMPLLSITGGPSSGAAPPAAPAPGGS